MKNKIILGLISIFLSMVSYGQTAVTEYIEQYAPLAIKQMQIYKIPASITLAQGILESACGTSRLAIEANNHFGIKCKSDWTGETILHDDDAKGECFRSYSNVEDSYEDHSIFLTTRSRYEELFKLQITDYKGWAYGLKSAGYATNPSYAENLIRIIENNELYKYDKSQQKKRESSTPKQKENEVVVQNAVVPSVQTTGEINGIRYIIAGSGDSYMSISIRTGIKINKLRAFNDLTYEEPLKNGAVVFLEKKAKNSYTTSIHTVKTRTTLYDISQLYGIQLKRLQKLNPDRDSYQILPIGVEIHLR